MFVTFRKIVPMLVLFLSAYAAMAQVATGAYPYGTFDNMGFDTINVGNLNVQFSIPILNKAGRGLPFNYNLVYESFVWNQATSDDITAWAPTQNFGWTPDTGATGYVEYDFTWPLTGGQGLDGGYYTKYLYSNFVYYDPSGGVHPFAGQAFECTPGDPDCTQSQPSFTSTATDGSGYTITVSNYSDVILTTQAGIQSNPPAIYPGQYPWCPVNNPACGAGPGTIIDRNGNYISFDGAGNFTDTTGNVVLTVAGSAPSAETFTYKDTNGNPQTITMNYETYTVQTAFNCSNGVGDFGPASESLVSSIVYPDGSTYNFSYEATPGVPGNVTGRIASVQLPQGGTIQYSYTGGNNGIECADGSAAGLTRTLTSDSGSATSTWTYSRTITGTGTSQTTVTDGLGNSKVYNFVEASNSTTAAQYYETQRSIYQGSASGTPVIARNTCYNGAASPCTTEAMSLPISQIDTYQTLDGIQTNGATAVYNSSGMQTESDAYDFGGATSRGALLRKEVWTYGYGVASLPTQDEVFDGSGNEIGNTLYGYDGTAPTPSSSGVPQHVAQPNPPAPRGNLTSVTSYASAGTSYLQTNTYEDTGSLLTSTTQNFTTTYTYDPTFVYLTGVSLPTPSSGVAVSSSANFDTANTGLPISSTDANGQITRISAYDSMLRPTQITYPDGGEATLSYTPTTLSTSKLQTANVSSSGTVQYDGYGRTSRAEVANGQGGDGYYQSDTCYDGNSNPVFTSYPYQGTGFGASKVCSGSGDTMTYDVLGRLARVIRANGETQTYTYTGRATKYIDANGVTRISQVDGLGRTTIVCEISSDNENMPGTASPTSCGTDIAGTGYTTNYSYALASGTTTITQGAQTRVFQTDWLGRTIQTQEPEAGTTNYSYAYNGTGLVVTRTRPTANQTSPYVLTTTTTQYDSLGRVVSITYNDGTPTKTYAYDASASANFSDLSQSNLVGRLSVASIAGVAGTAFSYDPMGRISAMDECLPSGCGNTAYNRQLQYLYDLAGDMTSSTDGSGVTSTYTYSPASEILSLTSSLSDSTDPSNIVSNMQYGPNGPINGNLGNGLSTVYHYDALGRLNGGWVCSDSNSASCSGGAQIYGFTNAWKQNQLICSSDTALNQGSNYTYDEFNRLATRTVNSGPVQNYAWTYDRYGNRWQQNFTGGTGYGNSQSLTFNTANNQVNVSGFSYDAAGNMTNDSNHGYTFDAEGNIIAVDAGQTATYVYNALNQRVQTVAGGTTTGYVFNSAGQRVSEWNWNGTAYAQLKGKYYLGGTPVGYYTTASSGAGAATHFEHQDWLGTERLRTTYNGSVEGSFTSLPFGDGPATTGADTDASHYATLDHDSESDTDHAQFRQYSNVQGRFLSPDSYGGSYDSSNPQSMNRYVYAMNNPLAYIDPSGQDCQASENGLIGTCDNPYDASIGGSGFGGSTIAFNGSQSSGTPTYCSQDGISTNCGTVEELLSSGLAVPDGWTHIAADIYSYVISDPFVNRTDYIDWGYIYYYEYEEGLLQNGIGLPFDPTDPGYQLAVALGHDGAYTLNSVCAPAAFYGASAAGAAGGVTVANIDTVAAATVGDYATWYGRAISWLNRVVGRTPLGPSVGAMAATAGSQVSQFCSSH